MTWTFWAAIVVVIATVYALIKRYETRLVLLTSGFVMAFISLQPMIAFKQFDKSMTNGSLIIAICSALGFAAVISLTKCDVHLVSLLMRPLKKLGVFLLPSCMIVTSVIATAIPSMAGLSAAVGPTMIPIMIRSGFKPAIAAAAVGGCMMPAYLNPGVSHNPFISKLASMEIMQFIGAHATTTVTMGLISIVVITITCFAFGDFKRGKAAVEEAVEVASNEIEHPVRDRSDRSSRSSRLRFHLVPAAQDVRCNRYVDRYVLCLSRYTLQP